MTVALLGVAKQEFGRVLFHPVVLVMGFIVLGIAYLNGAGYAESLQVISSRYEIYHRDAFIVGVATVCASTSMASIIMATFLGATTISNDRWKNTLNVLLSKPLYRRDYLFGKFLGLSAFMLLFNTFVFFSIALMVFLFYGGPLSVTDSLLKIASYLIALTLASMLAIAFNILFGVLSKNVLFVTTVAMTFIFVDRIWYAENLLGNLSILLPTSLYYRILDPTPYVPEVPLPLDVWAQYAVPYVVLLLVEMLILLLAGMFVFSRDDKA